MGQTEAGTPPPKGGPEEDTASLLWDSECDREETGDTPRENLIK